MHNFEELLQILGRCLIVKFRSDPRQTDPQDILRIYSTEKSCMHYWHCSIHFMKLSTITLDD